MEPPKNGRLLNFLAMHREIHLRQMLKSWILPIAMLGGILLHDYIDLLSPITPYLIFASLTVTYTKLKISELKITSFQWSLLCIHILGAVAVYAALANFSATVAAGAFMCFFMPTATAAPVITNMLGGNITKVATYSLLCNMAIALTAPSLLSVIRGGSIDFLSSFTTICAEVIPLLLIPFIIAILLKFSAPRLHAAISNHQSISFWIWAVSLFIVMGQAVSFMIKQPVEEFTEMIILAVVALFICCFQFVVGRKIGKHFGDKIAGAQGLMQKNTILGIWMTLTYLNPIVSVAPAAYIVWQNTINSLQIYFKTKREIKNHQVVSK